MKRVLAALFLVLALTFASAQADGNVSVVANQQGNSVSFYVTNTTSTTVCVFPYATDANNVYGSIVPMIQLGAGEANVGIGAYAQSNSAYAWYIYVGAKWRKGTCA